MRARGSTGHCLHLGRVADHGSALLITLFFLAIITVVAVGFMGTARVERATAHTHLERSRAAGFSQYGIEKVVATLQRETTYRHRKKENSVTRSWFRPYLTAPGALVVPAPPETEVKAGRSPWSLRQVVELSSGAPKQEQVRGSIFAGADLNIETFGAATPGGRLLTDRVDPRTRQAIPMRLRWIYLRENRHGQPQNPAAWSLEEDREERPVLGDLQRPIVGRYAYWADDESTKINYNIAWKRDPGPSPSAHSNPSRPSHPSRVNLMGLQTPEGALVTEQIADVIFRWRDRSPNRPFNSFADARQADSALARVLDFNKFDVTHYSHDPGTTFFGEDRILLTTRREVVSTVEGKSTSRFLDILRDDISPDELEPGSRDHVAGGQPDWLRDPTGNKRLPNKFDVAMRELVRLLRRSDWPLALGSSFELRYFGPGASDLAVGQLAANIIDYVRAKESRLPVVAPLRFGLDGAGHYTLDVPTDARAEDVAMGVSRAPYFTEMGGVIGAIPVPSLVEGGPRDENGAPKLLYPCLYSVELHIPVGYEVTDAAGFPGLDLVPVKRNAAAAQWFLRLGETCRKDRNYYTLSPQGTVIALRSHPTGALPILDSDIVGQNGTILQPGKHVVVTKLFFREEAYDAAPQASLRATLYRGVAGEDGLLAAPLARWPEVATAPLGGGIPYPLANPMVPGMSDLGTVEIDDPRCGQTARDWQPNRKGRQTLGEANSVSTLGKNPSRKAGEPQPDTDLDGLLTDASVHFPPPRDAGSNADVETADRGLVTSVGELGFVATGINLSGEGVPWRSLRLQPAGETPLAQVPDWALLDLFAVPRTSSSKVKEFEPLYAPYGSAVGGRVNLNSVVVPFSALDRASALRAVFYGAPGLEKKSDAAAIATAIVEGKLAQDGKHFGFSQQGIHQGRGGYETPGEICEISGVADRGEASEELVRDVVGLLTTRGNVFGIYSIGQSLVQAPGGKLVVTGEQRQHEVIERYIDTCGTPENGDDTVRFRTVYSRELSP